MYLSNLATISIKMNNKVTKPPIYIKMNSIIF